MVFAALAIITFVWVVLVCIVLPVLTSRTDPYYAHHDPADGQFPF